MKKRAFSLIELSIVLLIIGIIIAGVTQSSRLIATYRLVNARSITQSSPVASIKDLVVWWDATSKNALNEAEAEDGSSISYWKDINPQTSEKKVALQSDNNAKPTYKIAAINNLPALSFNGSSQYLQMDFDAELNTDNLSAFAVVKTPNPSSGDYGAIFSSRNGSIPTGYMMYKSLSNKYQIWYIDNGSWVGINYGQNVIANQNSLLYGDIGDNNSHFYLNGTLSDTVAITRYDKNTDTNFRIGAGTNEIDPSFFYNGYIGEIIIFNRVLKFEERMAIEEYLIKKWAIRSGS